MALRRKGTRTIVVDGVVYRWTITPDDEPGVGIVVEHAESPAQRLVSWVDHGVTISPRLTRAAIAQGLRSGWRPIVKGPDFVERLALPAENPSALKQCPCCDYFTLPRRGEYDICRVCFWEDDGADVDRLGRHSGPNHMTLRVARDNFRKLGACDERGRAHVLTQAQRRRFFCAPR